MEILWDSYEFLEISQDFHEYFGTIFECRLVNSGDVSIPETPPPRFELVRPPPTEMSLMASGMLSTGQMATAIPGMMESPHSEVMDGEEIQRRGWESPSWAWMVVECWMMVWYGEFF